jgi:hypothetical protein
MWLYGKYATNTRSRFKIVSSNDFSAAVLINKVVFVIDSIPRLPWYQLRCEKRQWIKYFVKRISGENLCLSWSGHFDKSNPDPGKIDLICNMTNKNLSNMISNVQIHLI